MGYVPPPPPLPPPLPPPRLRVWTKKPHLEGRPDTLMVAADGILPGERWALEVKTCADRWADGWFDTGQVMTLGREPVQVPIAQGVTSPINDLTSTGLLFRLRKLAALALCVLGLQGCTRHPSAAVMQQRAESGFGILLKDQHGSNTFSAVWVSGDLWRLTPVR